MGHRPGYRQRPRRGDRDRPPAGRVGHPDPWHARPFAGGLRAALGCRRDLHRRRPGARRRPREHHPLTMATFCATPAEAVAGIGDGATVMIGGFGTAGQPVELIEALLAGGARDLTVVNNNAGNGDRGLAALIGAGRVRKIICSFPRQADSWHFDAAYRAGEIELELVAQGNLAERIRAAGAGIGAFYTPTGFGTPLAEGKEVREIDGVHYVLEHPIRADVALVKAYAADRSGNLVYRRT